jgi:2-hydroxyglutaryl-CoA dehydratase, D-component
MTSEIQIPQPNLKDRLTHLKSALENIGRIGLMGLKHGPYDMSRDLLRYRWLWGLAHVNDLLAKVVAGRTGLVRELNCAVINHITAGLIEMLENLYYRSDKVILHEDLVPPEILYGMGLHSWMNELVGMVVSLIDITIVERYIDIAENSGIPADLCSLPKVNMGVALAGELPSVAAVVTSNQPCDSGMMSYLVTQQQSDLPTFYLDAPYNFHTKRANRYFVGQLKEMIAWLEQKTGARMDWDRMREVCERRNRMRELELEIWELMRLKPSPLAAEPVYFTHMMYTICNPGTERGVDLMQLVLDYTKQIAAGGQGAVVGEQHRVVLWNPSVSMFPDLFVWAEQKYRTAMLMDMLTYRRFNFIDTTSPDSMLEGLARVNMEGPMSRHTRGPAENFFSDLFHLYDYFNLDMIWMAGHIGCKNTQALLGIMRERCRRRDIPLLVLDYDLCDSRIVSEEAIKNQIEQYMDSVMHANKY